MFDCSANRERILKFYSYSGIDGIGSIECTLKQYLRNFATFTKIYWRTRFRKTFCQGYGNQIFDAMFSQILTFLIVFLLINNFFKANANSLIQSQEINIFFYLINFAIDL